MSTILQPLVLVELVIGGLLASLEFANDHDKTFSGRAKHWLVCMGIFQIPIGITVFVVFFLPWYMGLDF